MRRMLAALLCLSAAARADDGRHNVVLFVADGLRPGMIRPETAPAMAGIASHGTAFANTHSLFPTFTTANASAMATGHYLGDTGVFSNTFYAGFAVAAAKGSVTPFDENDAVLGQLDAHHAGDFVVERTVLAAARAAGLGTAAIGKLGPVLVQDHTARGRPDHRNRRRDRRARRDPAC